MSSAVTIRFYLAIVLLSLWARVGTHLVSSPLPGWALVLAVSGCLLLMVSMPPGKEGGWVLRAYLATIVAAGLAICLAGPVAGRLCYAVWAALILLSMIAPPKARRHLAALSIAGSLIIVCGASTVILERFAWRLHEVPLPDAAYQVVGLVSSQVGRVGDFLALWTGRELAEIGITFESVGLYEIWYLVVALVTVNALCGRAVACRSFLGNLAIIGVYAAIRFLVIASLAAELHESSLLWHPAYVVSSWLPLAVVLRAPQGGIFSVTSTGNPGNLGKALATGLPLLLGVLVALASGYDDPGRLKSGRIVIDETHADWEWVQEPFDTTSYGIRAEYNYYCLFDYLQNFFEVTTNTGGISRGLLDSADVLIIKTPTAGFDSGEVEAIQEFVKRGGGLFLVGDHTNLFGMSTYLNVIAQPFGMSFRYDDTFDLETTGFSCYRRSALGYHPALRWLREFEFLTSCSIQANLGIQPVMVGYGLGSEDIDYSHPNFFGNIALDLCDRFGLFLQAAGRKVGRGRVLLFTDSTCFSNFCLFSPGKAELLLGFIDYLNREGKRYPWAGPALGGALLFFVGLIIIRRQALTLGWLLVGLCLGLAVGGMVVAGLNGALYGGLPQERPGPRLMFDIAHGDVSFFDYLSLPSPSRLGFEELYLCALRIGAYPYGGSLLEAQGGAPEGIVLVNPCLDFSRREVEFLDLYLKYGGRILILDSIQNSGSTSNQLLDPYGIRLEPGYSAAGSGPGAGARIIPELRVLGGNALTTTGLDPGAAASMKVGKGLLVVATDSFGYSHHVLGSVLPMAAPSPVARTAYRTAYQLLRQLTRQVLDDT